MPSETIGEYEIEFSGEPLPEDEGWGAYVTIYGPSHNPMHRSSFFPHQRVAVETIFSSQQAAEEQARAIGISLLG